MRQVEEQVESLLHLNSDRESGDEDVMESLSLVMQVWRFFAQWIHKIKDISTQNTEQCGFKIASG